MREKTLALIAETEVELDKLQLEGAVKPDKWLEKRCYLRSLTMIAHDTNEDNNGQLEVLSDIRDAVEKIKQY